MPWKTDAPGCSCCGCERLTDDFSTDTLSNYTTGGSTWAIADGTLQGYASFGSTPLTIKSNVTSGLPGQIVSVRFKSPERRAVTLLVGMTSAIRYMACIVEYDSDEDSTCGTVYFKYFSGMGSTTEVGERMRVRDLPPDEFRTIEVCTTSYNNPSTGAVASVGLTAKINGQCLSAEYDAGLGTGVGLGTWADDSDNRSYFDDLTWSDSSNASTGGSNECPECGCPCSTFVDDFNSGAYTDADIGREIEAAQTVGCMWEVCSKNWTIQRGNATAGAGEPDALGDVAPGSGPPLPPPLSIPGTTRDLCLVGRPVSSSVAAHIKCLAPIAALDGAQSASVDVRGAAGTRAAIHLNYGGTTSGECALSYSAVIEFAQDYKKSKIGISDDGGASFLNWEYVETPGNVCRLYACWDAKFLAWVDVGGTVRRARRSVGRPDGDSPLAGLGIAYHDGAGGVGQVSPEVVRFDNFVGGITAGDCRGCVSVADSDCICERDDGLGETPQFLIATQPSGLLYPGDNEFCPVGMCASLGGRYLLSLVDSDPDVPGTPGCCWQASTKYGCISGGNVDGGGQSVACINPVFADGEPTGNLLLSYDMKTSKHFADTEYLEHYRWSAEVAESDFYCNAFTAELAFEFSDGQTECQNISTSTITLRNG